ncbi:hypothetical protein DF133_16080 [Burkholderia cenocepacia]|nr:hypothetical protein DF133_16080 [Burkholderia cenocepacia]
MKRYSELLQAKADQEKADFEMRQAEINRLNKLMRENRMRFEGMMSAYFRPEFTSFVKEIEEHKFFAEYSEVQDAGLTKRAQVLFRFHHDEDEVPLNRTDCCVWIELDAANGIVNWDYHGDLQVHEDNKLATGKLGDLGPQSIVDLPQRLEECLAACLEGRRVTNY